MQGENTELLTRQVVETRAALRRLEAELSELERRLRRAGQPVSTGAAEEYYLLPVGAG